MAVLVEGISVIIRRDTIARRYRGGWPGFVAIGVNSTLCADSEIARVGFMNPSDVGAFIRHLEQHGFVFLNTEGGPAVDIVVVDQREGPTTPCDWIEFFKQKIPAGEVSAACLAGSREQGLFTPDGWDFEHSLSKQHEFHPGTEPEDLELVRRLPGTDVYRNRKTGQEVYVGRPVDLDPSDQARSPADSDRLREYENLWNQAGEILLPYTTERKPTTKEEIAQVAMASDLLQRITREPGVSWRPWWFQGVARRTLQDHEGAYAAFSRAYGMAPHEVEVGRNLVAECLALGHRQEAVAVAAAMVEIAPTDAGLIANYALALLVSGNTDAALHEVLRAEGKDPGDEVTQNLRKLIEDVRAGKRPAPSRI